MNFVYDDDSLEWTNSLLKELRLRGYDYAVEMILDRTQELEEEVRAGLRRAQTLVRAGQVVDVLGAFAETPAGTIDAQLFLKIVTDDPTRISQVQDVLEKALSEIGAEQFKLLMPLNVLAALDVLFLLLIVPHRCLEASVTVVQDTLKQNQLVLVDNDGWVLWDSDQSRAIEEEEEAAFWSLVDGVLSQWASIAQLSTQGGEQRGNVQVAIGPTAAVYYEAQLVIGRILSERRAA